MSALQLSFLPTFRVEKNGTPITKFRSANVRGLLVYLALQPNSPHPREVLATLFWPDLADNAAKTNLRQTIYQLRKTLNHTDENDQPYLLVNRQTVQMNPASSYEVDVVQFWDVLDQDQLDIAAVLYQGDLLTGFTAESELFESWLRQERETLHNAALRAIDELGERHLRSGHMGQAEAIARQQLSLEPWSESAHRQLIEALARSGQRTAALAQYEQCCQILDEELGVEPSPETITLVEQVQNNQIKTIDPNLIAGRYSLGEEIGRGAMGVVYLGKDQQTGQNVAIKTLQKTQTISQPRALARFLREGDALRRLNHPNIVQLLATDERDGQNYLIMEYLPGGDLRHRLNQGEKFTIPQIITLCLDLADALTRAHRLDILHRDIKPGNILIDENGAARLTDFGIARLGGATDLTDDGVVLGTLVYISPEACEGRTLDKRTDIWSFGVLLYELLAGHPPFPVQNLSALIRSILHDDIPDIRTIRPDLPTPLANLLHRILVKDREDRVTSIRQVAAALEAILHGDDLNTPFEASALFEPPPISPPSQDDFTASLTETQPIKPFQAPTVPPHFVGRAATIHHLKEYLSAKNSVIIALVGMGGIGKSTLAAEVALQLRDQFRDGILWGNPHTSDPAAILESWGRAYHHDFSGMANLDSRVTAVRSMLADKESLLLLDNVESVASVRPLLQAGSQGAILITTRNLDIAATLNAHVIQLAELKEEDSRQLLVEILGETRVTAEREAAADICQKLHHLPLAVEIAAQRLKSRARMTLQAMAKRLDTVKNRLGLSIGDQAVRTSFQVSWDILDDDLRETFCGIAIFKGCPFTAEALAAVLDQDEFDVEDNLYSLSALSLARESGEIHYQQHPLLVDFATEKLDNPEPLRQRFIAFYSKFAQENKNNALKLDLEWENLISAMTLAQNNQDQQTVINFAYALESSWRGFGRFNDAHQGFKLAQTAASVLKQEENLAELLVLDAEIYIEQSVYDQALHHLDQAFAIYYRHENDAGVARTLYFQGRTYYEQGDFRPAEERFKQSYHLYQDEDIPQEEAQVLVLLALTEREKQSYDTAHALLKKAAGLIADLPAGEVHISIKEIQGLVAISQQDYIAAKEFLAQAIVLCEQLGRAVERATIARSLAFIHYKQENYGQAIQIAQSCLRDAQFFGRRLLEGWVCYQLAQIYTKTKDFDEAIIYTEKSLDIYQEIGDKLGYGYALLKLGEAHIGKGNIDYARPVWNEALRLGKFLKHGLLTQMAQQRVDSL